MAVSETDARHAFAVTALFGSVPSDRALAAWGEELSEERWLLELYAGQEDEEAA